MRHAATLIGLLLLAPRAGLAVEAAAPGRVVALHADAEHLWAATTSGLWRVDPRSDGVRVFTTADGLPSETIYSAASGADGTLWVATDRGPARRVGSERFEAVTDGLFSTDTPCVLPTSRGVFAGTARGVWRLESGRWRLVYDSHDVARDRVFACAGAPDGSAWFAKEDALSRIRPDGAYEIRARHPLDPDRAVALDTTRVASLAFDARGSLWLATDLGPRALDARGESLPVPPVEWDGARRPARPWAIHVDPDGTTWLASGPHRGARDDVVLRLATSDRWEPVRFPREDPPRAVNDLERGPQGALWAGTARGLYRLRDGAFVRWVPAP